MRRPHLANLLLLALAAAPAPAEEDRLAAARVAAAAELRAIETEIASRAAQVSALAERRAGTEQSLQRHRAALLPLLPVMQRLALYPAETLLAVPVPADQALRGIGVLHGLALSLEAEAETLRQEQTALDAQSRALEAALPGLRAAQARQAAQAESLDAQLAAAQARRRQADDPAAEAQRRAAAEAARAETLHGVVTRLEATRRPASSGLATSRAVIPVAGPLVRSWGEPTDAGPASGVSFRPPPLARVVAPCSGRIRFAGPFRSFGQLVILDCGGGLAFVLAGLEHLDTAVGAAALAGEPLGTMPGWDAATAGARPALYVELRRDGVAINPAPYLTASIQPAPSHGSR